VAPPISIHGVAAQQPAALAEQQTE